MAKQSISHTDILRQIQLRQFAPVYVFMGEQSYFIDRLTAALESTVLSPEEKLLNQTIRYGKDGDVEGLIHEAMTFPMLSEYRLILLKEAQTLDTRLAKNKWELLEHYLQHPSPQTVWVIAYKDGKLDRRKKWITMAEQIGVVYETPIIYENKMGGYVEEMAQELGISVEGRARDLLVACIGTDLTTMENTLLRLKVLQGEKKLLTVDLVQQAVRNTRKYSNFDLLDAFAGHNISLCNRILSQGDFPLPMSIAILFSYFSNLMAFHYLSEKTEGGAIAALRVAPMTARKLVQGARFYSAMKTFQIIGYLREYDAKSKGVGSSATPEELIKELSFKILH